MTPAEFNNQYLGEFKPDPIIEECVAFLRYASKDHLQVYKRQGLFSNEQIRQARRIIEIEESKECGQ